VKAVLGQRGIVEGQAYCGSPTIADVRAVPDSPWFLVARIDTAEVYAPLRERLWLTVFLAGVLLVSAGAGAGLLWRQQRVQFYKEQAQAAEALRASENRFRSLFDSSRDAVMTMEPPSWKFTSGNPAAVAMFGTRNAEHFVTFGPWELAPQCQPDGRASAEKAREIIETTMREGSQFFEWTHQRINGEAFPATVLLSRVEAAGKVFLQATVRDITEQKRAEEEKARLLAIIDQSLDFIGLADLQGNLLYHNRAAKEMVGLPEDADLAHLKIRDMHPPRGAKLVEEVGIPTLLREGSWKSENTLLHRNGSEIPVSQVLVVHRDSTGEPKFISTIIRDITERKRMEDRLLQLSRAVEQSPASIVITDPAGNIEYVNPRFVEVTGYTLAEILGKNPRVLKSDDKSSEAYRELWQTITAGKEWHGEFHNKKKNGELYWESASISPIRDLAGRTTHYVGVKEDITVRKQIEAERDQLIQDLQQALASVKSLSGLLPICAGCKKIRDDQGYWSQVESYIQKHSEATFTHGLCPDCIKKYYPDLGEAGPGDSPKEAS
jgi:PAS domain S-box-containing protein